MTELRCRMISSTVVHSRWVATSSSAINAATSTTLITPAATAAVQNATRMRRQRGSNTGQHVLSLLHEHTNSLNAYPKL